MSMRSATANNGDVFIAGIMEHIEEAGVHSGDSACSLPPHSSLKPRDHRRDRAPDHRHGPRPECPWTDECAICHPGRRDFRAGGQSPRQPHRALCRQGHRAAGGGHRVARDGGRDPGLLQPQAAASHMSRSRKRCCLSPASPASIPFWGRRCAPPAK